MIQRVEIPPPIEPIEEEVEQIEPVSYDEYKTIIGKQMEQQKIEKAKQKLKEQDLLDEQQPKKEKLPKLLTKDVVVGKKDSESMGDFMSRMVVTFDKDNRRKGRKSRVINVGGSVSRQRSDSRSRKSEPRANIATAIATVASNALASGNLVQPNLTQGVIAEPRQKTQEEQFVEDMLKIYNEDRPDAERPELCELLNYDVLLRTKKIIQRALMPPPRFKDDFHFTHLYQEETLDSPTGRRRGKKKGGKYTQDTTISYSYKADIVIPQSSTVDRQIKKLQTYLVQDLVGKRVNLQGYMEFMCTFDNARKSWILQSLMMKDYEHLMISYERFVQQRQMESKVCNSIMKVKEAFTYCLLSHKISDHKELPKIVYLKQNKPEPEKYLDDEKIKKQEDEEEEEQFKSKMFKSKGNKNKRYQDRDEIDINDSPIKKAKDRKKITDEQDDDLFDQQIQLQQKKDKEREDKALKKQQSIINKDKNKLNEVSNFQTNFIIENIQTEEIFEDTIDIENFDKELVSTENQSLNIQQEIKKLSTQQSSFKKQLQEQRVNKLMKELQMKQSVQTDYFKEEIEKLTLFK